MRRQWQMKAGKRRLMTSPIEAFGITQPPAGEKNDRISHMLEFQISLDIHEGIVTSSSAFSGDGRISAS